MGRALHSVFELFVLAALAALSQHAAARGVEAGSGLQAELTELTQQYDHAQFDGRDLDRKAVALEAVFRRAVSLADQYPNRAEPLCWLGWTRMAQSRVGQDFSVIAQNHEALRYFEAALAIDPTVYSGTPQAALGELYVFGSAFPFPILFGGKEKGRQYFQQGVQLNPSGLETNLPYANFLLNEKDFGGALQHAVAAAMSPTLVNRPNADQAFRKEAEKLLVWAFTPNR
ncbi:MAG TPA: hypothetical protein VK629_11340 [Steroidobacteraceae bacterium]|nr:hypothetical protein [Steroidobacteraceae bacterium]